MHLNVIICICKVYNLYVSALAQFGVLYCHGYKVIVQKHILASNDNAILPCEFVKMVES